MKYSVIKKSTINTDIANIHKNISDLTAWSLWSPWACLDPNTKINADSNNLTWESEFTGSGSMHIISKNENKICIDLRFIKPFKSQANVIFTLSSLNNNTSNITWEMHSRLPFFMCFLKKLFQVMIGRDFERGFIRLKYLSETGSIPSKMSFTDTPEKIDSFKIAGLSSKTHMSVIANSMHESITKLNVLVKQANIVPLSKLCFVNDYKVVKEIMSYTIGAKYKGNNITLGELKSMVVPTHKAIKVTLYGSYDFMGDAWSALHAHSRGLKLKHDKKVPPYEVYVNGPHNTESPEDYITEIYMPIK